MINNVTLVGRLTREPELRYTPTNQAVATFSIAVNRPFKNADGEREADFINCVMWRQQAENFANWANKGNLIGIVGRIQTRNYENQQGQRVYVTEVVAENFQMLESRQERGASTQTQSYQQPQMQQPVQQQQQPMRQQPIAQQQQPMQQQPVQVTNNQNDPFGGSPMEIADDDLPF